MTYTTFKTLRIRKKISQKDLAKLSGVNLRTIQSLECGARSTHRMTLENAYRLASVLGIPMASFLEKEDIVFPDGRNGLEFEEDVRMQKKAAEKAKEEAKQLRLQNHADDDQATR